MLVALPELPDAASRAAFAGRLGAPLPIEWIEVPQDFWLDDAVGWLHRFEARIGPYAGAP